MLDMGRHWQLDTRVARPWGRARRSVGPDLVVDLFDEPFTKDWWRGALTLALLCSSAAMLMPRPFEPLPAAGPAMAASEDESYRELGLSSLATGAVQGGRMAPGAAAMPIAHAPERAHLDLGARLSSDDRLIDLLVRLGATPLTARAAADAVGPVSTPDADLEVRLGARQGAGRRGIEALTIRASLDTIVHVRIANGALEVRREKIATDNRPLVFSGVAGEGLYFAMRSAGVASERAADVLKVFDDHLDLASDVLPGDRFTLVMDNRRNALGESEPGALRYAAIERHGGDSFRLMKWPVGGRNQWVDVDRAAEQRASSGQFPVAAPITSGFGMRRHPILRYMRMHSGLDFGASWGTPIVAAGDGVVAGAGWAGGYGRQVRIDHAGNLSSSYSHMSRFVVAPGMAVQQGQIIGYVGSSGLSTGPHLHYEVKRGGVAVDPRAVAFASRPVLSKSDLAAMRSALATLLKSARG